MTTRYSPLAIASFFSLSFYLTMSCATPQNKPQSAAQSLEHEAHHPEGTVEPKDSEGMDMKEHGGMMTKMDMKKMMDKCMADHKDNEMCNQKMMENCQKNMKTQNCESMRSDAKVKGSAFKGKL